jgi:hypothetical protein
MSRVDVLLVQFQGEMLGKADESGWLVLDASTGDPVGQIGDSFE